MALAHAMTQRDSDTEAPPTTIALVNNMPDAAFVDTENQFRRATRCAPGLTTELELFTITELPRSDRVAAIIGERYRGLDELWTRQPDALIVTGTEPTQSQIQFEPFWPYLARLLQWAADNVRVTLLSCMAAHASLMLFDGIRREARPTRCGGIFPGTVQDHLHALAAGLPAVVPVPHSRMNDVPVEALRAEGFDGRLVLFGAEPHRPYERPPLSKEFLAGKKSLPEFTVQDAAWYRDHDVDLRLGARATAVDPAAHTIALDPLTHLVYFPLEDINGAPLLRVMRQITSGLP